MEAVIESERVQADSCNDLDREMGTLSIKSLYLKYTLAALIGMGIQMFSVIADGLFVGNGVGPAGLATISIVAPFWTLFVAVSSLIGIGATSISAMNLGKGNIEEARSYFAQGFWYAMVLSIIISAVVLLNLDSVVRFFGASGEVIKLSKEYLSVYMYGFPFCVGGIYLFYYVRVDEKPILGTVALALPTVVSIAVEWYTIFVMKLGMLGAAFSWVLCVGLAFLLIFYFVFSNTVFKIKLSDLKFDFKKLHAINKVGFASFSIQLATMVVTILVNNLLGIYGGKDGLDIAAYGLINAYTLYILTTLVTAFTIGIQPLASYNCGACFYGRVKELIITGVKYTFVSILLVLVLIFIFSKQIFGFFTGGFQPLVELTSRDMRIFLLLFPLGAMSMLVSGYFQAIEHNGKAIFNGMTRIFVFAVPLVYVFSKIWGLNGIWVAQPVADFLAFFVAAIYMYFEFVRLNELSKNCSDK